MDIPAEKFVQYGAIGLLGLTIALIFRYALPRMMDMFATQLENQRKAYAQHLDEQRKDFLRVLGENRNDFLNNATQARAEFTAALNKHSDALDRLTGTTIIKAT